MLIGIGFSPLYAAGLALLANTSPVAFGALGTPILTLAEVSGIDKMALSQMAGRQLRALLPGHSHLAGVGHVGLERRERVLAGDPGLRRQLRGHPIGHVEPARADAGERVRRHRLAPGADAFAAILAAGRSVAVSRRGPRRPRRPDNAAAGSTANRLRMDALDVAVGDHLRVGLAVVEEEARRQIASSRTYSLDSTMSVHERVYRTGAGGRSAPGADRAAGAEPAIFNFNWLSATGTGIFLAADAHGHLAADRPG